MFAQRVADGARNAVATIRLQLGDQPVSVKRQLSDLKLLSFEVAGQELPPDEVTSFQAQIPKLVGVWSFGDWILLLRHLVFYFEDRRALVWDPSAQRQVLRMLLLPAETAQKWTEDERAILELDSQVRNLGATLFSQQRAMARAEVRASSAAGVRAQLGTLEQLQAADAKEIESLDADLLDLDTQRQHARLSALKAEQGRESGYRELERAKLLAIEARFPETSATARYIMAQILTEQRCLVCGNNVPQTATELETRIQAEPCVICASDVSRDAKPVRDSEISDKRVSSLSYKLRDLEAALSEARRHLEEVSALHDAKLVRVAELNEQSATRAAEIDSLVKRLPPQEAAIHQQRNELAVLRARHEVLKAQLEAQRQSFGAFVEDTSRSIVTRSEEIQKAFGHHAEDFLIEDCSLIWAPQPDRVGQTGQQIEFPAFEFEMSGASFPSPVRRSGPEQVSESQREFIDLAFRMALMQVAGSSGRGSLVIDAPESSLDAVFAARAANVLARFSEAGRGNRLIVTSNLVEGRLIPSLLAKATGTSAESGLVDLFDIAEPTAAVRQLKSEYGTVLNQMVSDAWSQDATHQGSTPGSI
jgi:hypothetical protein